MGINSVCNASTSVSSCNGNTGSARKESCESALLNGSRPELNNMIQNCGGSANKAQKGGESGCGGGRGNTGETQESRRSRQQGRQECRGNDQQLMDLLKNVLKDGKITPEEIKQLQQLMASNTPNSGDSGAGDRGGRGRGNVAPGGSCNGGRNPSGPDNSSGPTGPSGPTRPDSSSGIDANGTLTLGNTTINIQGGTADERSKTANLMQQMYDKDPGFRQGVDSKAGSGLNITIKDLPGNIAGFATVGGNTMSLDPEGLQRRGNDYANTIAHELAHNLGQGHGASLEAFASRAAAVTA